MSIVSHSQSLSGAFREFRSERLARAMLSLNARILVFALIGLGLLLRASQYLSRRSLWMDEAMLALNIIHKSYAALLKPLDYNQAAPVGFLWVERAAVQIFGDNELALRLFPFLCGIGVLFLFYRLVTQVLDRSSVIAALLLCSCSYRLIYYSSEVKPYIVDTFVLLILLYSAIRLDASPFSRSRTAAWCGLGALLIWFSYSAGLVLAGASACLLADYLFRKDWRALFETAAACLLWALSATLVYYVSHQYTKNQYLMDYWSSSFMPMPPKSMADIRWFDNTFLGLFQNPIGLFPSSVAAFAFINGCVRVGSQERTRCALLLSPVVAALVASAFRIYPFNGRLLLFIIPSFLILVSAGAAGFAAGERGPMRSMNRVMTVVLVVPVVLYSMTIFAKPLLDEDIKPTMDYMRKHWIDGDIVYVDAGSVPAFVYYAEKYGFKNEDYTLGRFHGSDPSAYAAEVDGIGVHRRLWLLVSHIRQGEVGAKTYLPSYVERKSRQAMTFEATGAFVRLYEVNADR
jgi:hypothetical protein